MKTQYKHFYITEGPYQCPATKKTLYQFTAVYGEGDEKVRAQQLLETGGLNIAEHREKVAEYFLNRLVELGRIDNGLV